MQSEQIDASINTNSHYKGLSLHVHPCLVYLYYLIPIRPCPRLSSRVREDCLVKVEYSYIVFQALINFLPYALYHCGNFVVLVINFSLAFLDLLELNLMGDVNPSYRRSTGHSLWIGSVKHH